MSKNCLEDWMTQLRIDATIFNRMFKVKVGGFLRREDTRLKACVVECVVVLNRRWLLLGVCEPHVNVVHLAYIYLNITASSWSTFRYFVCSLCLAHRIVSARVIIFIHINYILLFINDILYGCTKVQTLVLIIHHVQWIVFLMKRSEVSITWNGQTAVLKSNIIRKHCNRISSLVSSWPMQW